MSNWSFQIASVLVCVFLSCQSNNNSVKAEYQTEPNLVTFDEGPLEIEYPLSAIQVLKNKIKQTRYPDEIPDQGNQYGYSKLALQNLMEYWQNEFDFSQHLERINQWSQFIKEVDGYKLHYIHEKSKSENAIPIVLLHGWPSTYMQMGKVIPLLKEEIDGISFDIIALSLPGYGFSEIPKQAGTAVHKMADLMQKLITEELGYDKFIVRGSDIGAGVAKEWALAYPDNVLGLHLSGSNPYIYYMPSDLSKGEQAFVQNAQAFMQRYGAYAALHSTEPQTLAYALNDSPAGLAAWILQRYANWTDHDGNLETVYSKDDLLDILTIYWMSGSINSSMRSYYESANVYSPNAGKKVKIPTAFLMLKNDIVVAPREWEGRTYSNIIQWNENGSGGHFGEWEAPTLMAEDIRKFAKLLSRK